MIICRRCGQNVEDWRINCDAAAHAAVRKAHAEAEAVKAAQSR